MNWKIFFKPTLLKIIIFIILCLGVWFLAVFPGGEYFARGFPLLYYERGASQLGGSGWSKIHYVSAIIDILILYLVSCGIFSLVKRKD